MHLPVPFALPTQSMNGRKGLHDDLCRKLNNWDMFMEPPRLSTEFDGNPENKGKNPSGPVNSKTKARLTSAMRVTHGTNPPPLIFMVALRSGLNPQAWGCDAT